MSRILDKLAEGTVIRVGKYISGLSDKEKEQLLKSIDDVVVDIKKKSDEITDDIQTAKDN